MRWTKVNRKRVEPMRVQQYLQGQGQGQGQGQRRYHSGRLWRLLSAATSLPLPVQRRTSPAWLCRLTSPRLRSNVPTRIAISQLATVSVSEGRVRIWSSKGRASTGAPFADGARPPNRTSPWKTGSCACFPDPISTDMFRTAGGGGVLGRCRVRRSGPAVTRDTRQPVDGGLGDLCVRTDGGARSVPLLALQRSHQFLNVEAYLIPACSRSRCHGVRRCTRRCTRLHVFKTNCRNSPHPPRL
jgi:hypothetical protein